MAIVNETNNKETVSIDVNVKAECECKGCNNGEGEEVTKPDIKNEQETGAQVFAKRENEYKALDRIEAEKLYKSTLNWFKRLEGCKIDTVNTMLYNTSNELLIGSDFVSKGNVIVELTNGDSYGVGHLFKAGTSKEMFYNLTPQYGALSSLTKHKSELANPLKISIKDIAALYNVNILTNNYDGLLFILEKNVFVHANY
ncbi:gp202 [Bacillus phage W.Ph.]|uniref:Gp202 n=1 Tax=Bacillus phage W.Ph. TaxID=764595 RepID=G9B1V3_9CAUD|nr:gp202 [Bacillus phage W.Ph.]ADH03348.1 gp202 [Bacillus phage W.Ph.]